MRDRSLTARLSARRIPLSVDVAILTPHGRRLAVLLTRSLDSRSKERWELPWSSLATEEQLDDCATRVAREVLGVPPAWIEQVGAFGDKRRHPGGADVSVAFMALIPAGTPPPVGGDTAWFPADDLALIPPRQRSMIDGAMQALLSRLDSSPVAFRLLPATFTLSQLQDIYEVLLGRRLHKASFRRALHAAWLVDPTDEWRSEGRGRPAQLFRYAPRKRRGARRGVRFEGLGTRD
ncbi:MAG: NUDIX domain-containing protein [Gemmatimonadaceae bacterium]